MARDRQVSDPSESDTQEPSIASHLKGMDSSLQFIFQGPSLTSI